MTPMHWDRTARFVRKQVRFLFNLVGIPLILITLLSLILMSVIGGADLLRFAASQLLTWRGIRRVLVVVGGSALFALANHLAWHQDEPPPMWFRRSVWLNVLEGFILLVVIVVGAWAFFRFAPLPLPSH